MDDEAILRVADMPTQFQNDLVALASRIAQRSNQQFLQSFGRDWPDEESATGGLLGALTVLANTEAAGNPDSRINLRATLTRKRDEALHGADALIRFRCDEQEWRINTSTLLQAKRQEPGHALGWGNHQRLGEQLAKMLRFTPESYVMIYSQEQGVELLSATSAQATSTRDLFDMHTITWDTFLTDIFIGRIGESVPERVPGPDDMWQPMWELDLAATARSVEIRRAYATR